MTDRQKAHIIGMGAYVPERVMTNADFEKIVDTSDEWIVTRTGIKERRIASEEQSTSDMGVLAARRALDDAGLSIDDIDLILVATMTPDYLCPSVSTILQRKLGAKMVGAVDISAACCGYVYGISIAKAYVEAGMYRNVLFVTSEKMSAIVDYKDRRTCVVFGDGAAAMVVSCQAAKFSIDAVCLGADGQQGSLMQVPAGGSQNPVSLDTIKNRQHYFTMNGREVFKGAVRQMEEVAKECLAVAGIDMSEISWLIPHQANARIIEAMAKRCNLPDNKVYNVIHRYGNTSASSIPIAFCDLVAENSVTVGERLLFVAFGAGATWGATLLKKIS